MQLRVNIALNPEDTECSEGTECDQVADCPKEHRGCEVETDPDSRVSSRSADASPIDGLNAGYVGTIPYTEPDLAHSICGTSRSEYRSETDRPDYRSCDRYLDDLRNVPLYVCSGSHQHADVDITGLQQGGIPTTSVVSHRPASPLPTSVSSAPPEGAIACMAGTVPSSPLDPPDGQISNQAPDLDVETLSLTLLHSTSDPGVLCPAPVGPRAVPIPVSSSSRQWVSVCHSVQSDEPPADDTPACPTYRHPTSDAEEPPDHCVFSDVTADLPPPSRSADDDDPLIPLANHDTLGLRQLLSDVGPLGPAYFDVSPAWSPYPWTCGPRPPSFVTEGGLCPCPQAGATSPVDWMMATARLLGLLRAPPHGIAHRPLGRLELSSCASDPAPGTPSGIICPPPVPIIQVDGLV